MKTYRRLRTVWEVPLRRLHTAQDQTQRLLATNQQVLIEIILLYLF
jgi:hypothetical protein